MATQTTNGGSTATERQIQEAVECVRDLNERIIETSRKTGVAYVDSSEKLLKGVADFEERVATRSQVEWISALAQAQADFTREMAKVYTSAAREVLK